jgi:hypothetical protein
MKDRPFEFRTSVVVSTLLGLVMALLIHFVVLSSRAFDWLKPS